MDGLAGQDDLRMALKAIELRGGAAAVCDEAAHVVETVKVIEAGLVDFRMVGNDELLRGAAESKVL